jgi:predicted cupin superfamily sugar epimerase
VRAADVIAALALAPHPEGGWYRETFRDPQSVSGRSASTAIYYLLEAGEVSRWHRIDAVEIWHWHAGGAMAMTTSRNGHGSEAHELGPALGAGQRPQLVVPAGHWQMAKSLGAWTLVGCTVAPGFRFEGFELAPEGWQPDAVRQSAYP